MDENYNILTWVQNMLLKNGITTQLWESSIPAYTVPNNEAIFNMDKQAAEQTY